MYLHNFFEQFELISIFSLLGLKMTNTSLYLLIALGAIVTYYALVSLRWQIFPQGWQSSFELLYDFIFSLLKSQVGKKGLVYFPIVIALFLWVIFLNVLGMFPFGFTVTSHIAVTGGLALSVFIGIQVIGIVILRLEFLQLFLPNGAPMWLLPIIPVIEIISYSFRVFSLAIRLIANMVSGHLLIHIFAGFAWKMLVNGGLLYILFPLTFAIVFLLTGMEMAIAFLQGYVFTILVCIYLVDVIYGHGE